MSNSSIQDQLLEVTVVGCTNLARTEWITKQDPYVCLEYGGQNCRTRACTDGDKYPSFREKFMFKLIEGIREINVNVWNKNVIAENNFIASGKILLTRVIKEGYDDTPWPLLNKSNRAAGDLRAILHYENATKNTDKPEEKPTPPPSPVVYQPPPVIYQPLPPFPVYQQPPPPVYPPPPPPPGYPPPPLYPPPSPPYMYPSTPPHPTFTRTITTPLPHSYYCHTCGIFIYGTSEYHHHRGHHLHQGYQQESSEYHHHRGHHLHQGYQAESSEWYSSSTSHQPPHASPLPPQRSISHYRESSQPFAPTEPSEHYQSYPRHYYY